MITRLLLALALLPGLTAPAAAQGAAPSPGPEIVKAIAAVSSSDAAVQEAQQKPDAEIVALYVIDDQVPASVSSWLIYVGFMGDKPSDEYHHTILKEYRRRALEDLDEVAHKIAEAGVTCRGRLDEGPLLETIARVAEEEQAEMLIMLLPGKSDVGSGLYHEAAKILQKTSPRPVKIIDL